MTKDLTVGRPLKVIFNFAVPVFFGYLFQQFYNLVDTIIVGQFLGVSALAAVGSTGSLNFMIIGFCMGLCSGFAIPVAQKFGARDFCGMRQFVFNSAVLAGIFAVVLTAVTVIFCRPLLLLLKTPADVIDGAYDYFVIILAGIPVVILYNLLSGIIRSVGDSRTPLFFLIFSAVFNIILDLVFIACFGWGIPGAAWATVISQGAAGVICLFYMHRKFEILRLNREDRFLSPARSLSLLGTGVPMGLQYSITAIGSVILQAAVNVLGSVYVASIATGAKINVFFATPFDALGTTMATYGGQNVGAGKTGRLNSGLLCACLIGFIYSAFAFVVMFFGSEALTGLFMNRNEEAEVVALVCKNVRLFLLVNSACYVLLVLVNVVRFMIQGMGFSGIAVFAGVFELVGRGIIGIVFIPVFGFAAACAASPLAWLLADGFLIPTFFLCCRKLKER
ncbi:MATE family efflux transporter [uncultured Treponema sp.]|uniref:MATE family efflux transporter n=1 Tax=uncultured Treponema sp. TaxID=162155 RepID=UPI0015B79BDB|nr:MATE family efflux transporter [uncultured Treponema sp.]